MTNLTDYRAEQQPELKPCPFCSGEYLEIEHAPTYMEVHPDVYWINCCDCGVRGSEEWTEDEAIAAWNNRAERTCKDQLDGRDPCVFVCSLCEHITDHAEDERPNYCPSCGAKVD